MLPIWNKCVQETGWESLVYRKFHGLKRFPRFYTVKITLTKSVDYAQGILDSTIQRPCKFISFDTDLANNRPIMEIVHHSVDPSREQLIGHPILQAHF